MGTRTFPVEIKNETGEALVKDLDVRLVTGNNPNIYTVLNFAFSEGQQPRGDLSFDFKSFTSGIIHDLDQLQIADISKLCLSDDGRETTPEQKLFKLVLSYKAPYAKSPDISRSPNFTLLEQHLEAKKLLVVYAYLSNCDKTYLDSVLQRVKAQISGPPPDGYYKKRIRTFDSLLVRQLSRKIDKTLPRDPRVRFKCVDDYLLTQAVAIQLENSCKHGKILRYCKREHQMVVMEMFGCGNRKYQVFLPPDLNNETRIQPGDEIKVLFPGRSDLSTAWTIVVLPPLPNTPEGYLSGQMSRPWTYVEGRKEEDCYDDYELQTISAGEKEPIRRILTDKGITVKVSIDFYDALLERRLACMQYMGNGLYDDAMTENVVKVLTGHNLASIKTFDIFRSIRTEFDGRPEELITGLNPEQLSAINKCQNSPAGIVCVQGPPGTGKTHFVIAISTPFIMSKLCRTILVTTQTNVGTDNLAVLFQEKINQFIQCHPDKPWLQDKYVIRAHVNDTEMAIYSEKAKEKRKGPVRPSDYREPSEAEKEMLKTLEIAHIIAIEMQKDQSQTGTGDKRVREVGLSVGMRMMQMAGIVPGGPKPKDPEMFNVFRTGYLKWANYEDMDDQEQDNFYENAKALRDFVVKNAAVVCTTMTNASSSFVSKNLHNSTELVIADEMPRCLEADALLLFMGRFNSCGYIMVGDINQLGPYIESAQGSGSKRNTRDEGKSDDTCNEPGGVIFNPFKAQLRMSVQERLQEHKFPTTLLKEQHRSDPNLSKDTSEVIYGSQLRDHKLTIDRPLAIEFKDFTEKKFGVRTNKLLLNVPEIRKVPASTTRRATNMSRYNEYHVMYIINLAEELTQQFPSATIAILTGYQSQYHLLTGAKQRMIFHNAPHENISIHKIDIVQGLEFDFVILDQLFLSRGSAGFMRDPKRLNVATSRAKHGMYILANVKAYKNISQPRRDNSWVGRFMGRWLESAKDVDLAGTVCKYYQLGQTDVKTGEQSKWI